MNLKMKKAGVFLAFCCIAGFSLGKDVKLAKEKVPLEFKVPPLIELAPKEATYKFLYPKELSFYRESEFSKFASGFNDVDGIIGERPRYFLPKRVVGNVPTDYTFELIPSGIKNLTPTSAPYSSYSHNSGFVQDFQFNFACTLKVYKKDQLVKEYVIDNGSTPHAATYFVNYRLEGATQQAPYVGFANAQVLEQSIAKKGNDFAKFCFLIEYKTYRMLFDKACFTILNLYGDFNFKYAFPLNLVHEKDAAQYPEFNTHGANLQALLAKISKFEDIAANADAFRQEGDYFGSFSEKEGLDKDFRSAAQRNAAVAFILAGNESKAFDLIKKHDDEIRVFGSARAILFDIYNMCSAYSYYKNLPSGVMVESTTLNDLFDKEINEKRKLEAEEKRKNDEGKKRAEELEKIAFQELLNKRNFVDVQATIHYDDKTTGSGICTFTFFKLNEYGELDKNCGYYFSVQNPPKEPMVCGLNHVNSIDIIDKTGTPRSFMPITIVQSPLRRIGKLFNENKLLEYRGSFSGCSIFLDRTDREDDAYVIVPLSNNPKGKGYRLADIISTGSYPDWMKSNVKVEEAIKSGVITRTENGAKKLCEILRSEKLPLEVL